MVYSLGIDTSNYTTSVALVDEQDNILYDDRRLLNVKDGELGLRQQEAFFQHVKRLPGMTKALIDVVNNDYKGEIGMISVSDKPRNVEGSYMPCFQAGVSIAKTLNAAWGIPIKYFSHQEGHIEAGKRFSSLRDEKSLIAFHFSGGTTEALEVNDHNIELIGGTNDISFGQLIDRIGQMLGYPFPSGEQLDYGAIRSSSGREIYNDVDGLIFPDIKTRNIISDFPISKVINNKINLSGIETWLKRHIEKQGILHQDQKDLIALALFTEIGSIIIEMMKGISLDTCLYDFLFVGGVSSSSYIRSYVQNHGKKLGFNVAFASPDMSSDNAVGIALLGGESLWQ